jgi:hypothetical protein
VLVAVPTDPLCPRSEGCEGRARRRAYGGPGREPIEASACVITPGSRLVCFGRSRPSTGRALWSGVRDELHGAASHVAATRPSQGAPPRPAEMRACSGCVVRRGFGCRLVARGRPGLAIPCAADRINVFGPVLGGCHYAVTTLCGVARTAASRGTRGRTPERPQRQQAFSSARASVAPRISSESGTSADAGTPRARSPAVAQARGACSLRVLPGRVPSLQPPNLATSAPPRRSPRARADRLRRVGARA